MAPVGDGLIVGGDVGEQAAAAASIAPTVRPPASLRLMAALRLMLPNVAQSAPPHSASRHEHGLTARAKV